jgi:type II secretory pathway component GspD/PulD (secretin)
MASLLASSAGLRAAENEASVKLTGVAEGKDRPYALFEIISRPGRPVVRPILAIGERAEGVEVKDIDTKSGRVRVINNGVETFYLVDDGEPAASGRALHFNSVDLAQFLEIYQELSGRTVLRPDSLPGTKISIRTQTELTRAETMQALDSILSMNGITTRPRGEKFIFVVQSNQANRLSFISDPPAASSAGEILPPGLIKFMEADIHQVLEIYQELSHRTVLKPSDLVGRKVSVRTQTELTREEAIWVFDAMLGLADIAMIPQGDKFVFTLPGIQNAQVPHFEPNPVPAALEAKEEPAGLMKFQSADLSQVLPHYANLLGRQPLPIDRTTPAVKLSVRSQTPLTRAEAIFALDALAAVNRLKFVLVGDDKVKVLPAALARGETNSAQ